MSEHGPESFELRRRAERRLDPDGFTELVAAPGVDPARLVYELQVHQVELEMQNEELRRARDQVEAMLARYTDLYDFAPVGYLTLSADGVVTQVNLTGAKLMGVDRSWLVHRHFSFFLDAPDRARFADFLRTVFSTHQRAVCELSPPQKNGPLVSLRIEGTHVEQGNECRVALFDITAEKRADIALHLRVAALNAAANAILITDRNGTIEWVNAGFTQLTGYSAYESIGKNPRQLVKSGIHGTAFYKTLWDTILRGAVWQGEITNRRKDGTRYVEERTITPFRDERGEIVHFISIGRDLTEQRQLEAQLGQSHKMETVGRLAGGIAHDFNNLLTVINGTVELIMAEMPRDVAMRQDLEQVREAGTRAATLTRQLLAFSRKQVMKFDVIDMNRLMAGVQAMLQRLIGEHIELMIEPTDRVGCVRADPTHIEQVVMNLAVNARDAMPLGGTLTLATRNVVIGDSPPIDHVPLAPGEYVQLVVSDTGAGMDDAVRSRVFEPFFTTKGLGQGTGLGLSMVYGIVKQSGGSIFAQSSVGQGSTFTIYLPRVYEVSSHTTPVSTPAAMPGTETVLLVEDEDGVRRLAERVLRIAGYKVLTAGNGLEALELLRTTTEVVPLMVTDIVMPGMGGSQLAEECRKLRPLMKVIFTSGYADDATLHDRHLDTTVPFIAKPYTAAELTRCVREVLDADSSDT